MFVYILYSKSLKKFYVGQTQDLIQRFKDHNSGRTVYTNKGKPWDLVWNVEVLNRSESVLLEKKIKGRGAKRYLQGIGFLD